MARHQVVTPNIPEGLQSCNPCYQLRSLQASFAKSEVALADPAVPQNLRRLIRLSYSLLWSKVYLFSIQSTPLAINERSALTGKISVELKRFVKSASQQLAQFVKQGNTWIGLDWRFHSCWGLPYVGLPLGQRRCWSSNAHVRKWYCLQILNALLPVRSSIDFHLLLQYDFCA